MWNNEKVVFIGNDENEVEELRIRLKDITNIEYVIRKYIDRYLLIANNEVNYYIGVIIGNLISVNNHYNIKWISVTDNINKLNEMCICKLCLEAEDEILLEIIDKFKQELSCELMLPIIVKYESSINTYEFYIKLTDIFLEEVDYNNYDEALRFITYVQNMIFNFANTYKFSKEYKIKNVLDAITCFDFVGNVVFTNEKKQDIEKRMLINYFERSSLVLGLLHPEGYNLSPKVQENSDYINEKYYCSASRYSSDFKGSIRDFKVCNNGIELEFDCITYFEEEYRLANDVGCKNLNNFIMKDTLDASCKIEILSDTKLSVKSDVTVTRKVECEKLCSKPTVYDALYQNKDYTDTTFSFCVTDYYEIIDLNLLLHYTDSSKFYETFEIPIGFKFGNGLIDVENIRTIYDDNEDNWICYEDISEIKEYLLKKQF